MKKKTVLVPIQVPEGKYCWDRRGDSTGEPVICEHFKNDQATLECEIGFSYLHEEKDGSVTKPRECQSLKEALVLVDGRIPPHTICPWRKQCIIAENGRCNHRGELHENPFSCAVARGFEILNKPTDKELENENE